MQKNLLSTLFISLITLHFCNSCDNNNENFNDNNTKSKTQTVTKKEVLNYLNLNQPKIDNYLNYDTNSIREEFINDDKTKLVVLNTQTSDRDKFSRLLFLKINDTIKSVVFNMNPIDSTKIDENFTGEITLKSLDGNLIKGYRVFKGIITNKYIPINNYAKNRNKSIDETDCDRSVCGHT